MSPLSNIARGVSDISRTLQSLFACVVTVRYQAWLSSDSAEAVAPAVHMAGVTSHVAWLVPVGRPWLVGLLDRELAGVGDNDVLGGGARLRADLLDLPDHVHAVGDRAEHDVAAIEPPGAARGCRRRRGRGQGQARRERTRWLSRQGCMPQRKGCKDAEVRLERRERSARPERCGRGV